MAVQPAVGEVGLRQMWKKIEEPAFGTTLGGALWAMKSLSAWAGSFCFICCFFSQAVEGL